MASQTLIDTGSVVLLATQRRDGAAIGLWGMRLADESLTHLSGEVNATDATWAEVAVGMRRLMEPSCTSVVLRDGCVLERDDDERPS